MKKSTIFPNFFFQNNFFVVQPAQNKNKNKKSFLFGLDTKYTTFDYFYFQKFSSFYELFSPLHMEIQKILSKKTTFFFLQKIRFFTPLKIGKILTNIFQKYTPFFRVTISKNKLLIFNIFYHYVIFF